MPLLSLTQNRFKRTISVIDKAGKDTIKSYIYPINPKVFRWLVKDEVVLTFADKIFVKI